MYKAKYEIYLRAYFENIIHGNLHFWNVYFVKVFFNMKGKNPEKIPPRLITMLSGFISRLHAKYQINSHWNIQNNHTDLIKQVY